MADGQLKMIIARREGGVPVAAYVYLPNHPDTEGCAAKTVSVGHGVMLDFDADGKLIGVEILLPLPKGGGVG